MHCRRLRLVWPTALAVLSLGCGMAVVDHREVSGELGEDESELVAVGLRGEYYAGRNFERLGFLRTDPTIGFRWGKGAPDAALAPDGFSVRWSANLTPRFSERYTFHAWADDGIRVWVNGQKVIDDWGDHGARWSTGALDLVAGQAYALVVEYYESAGEAVAELHWSSPSLPMELVPAARLRASTRGNGLWAEYFRGADFERREVVRTDARPTFYWGSSAPGPALPADGFSVRWTGTVVPRFTEPYTFTVYADDGVRLWLDGALVADAWAQVGYGKATATVRMQAGRAHQLRFEYRDREAAARVALYWQSPSQSFQSVPEAQLFPPGRALAGCAPTTCAAQGKTCGRISDRCGGALSCGLCAAGQACGGGGTENVCRVPTGQVRITAPAPGARVDGQVAVAVEADVLRVRRVELYVDGAKVASDGLAPFEPSWNAREAVGRHRLEARAVNDVGEVVAGPPIEVTVGLTVKVLSLVYDPILEAQGGKRLRVAKEWNDPAALTQAYFADLEQASGGFVKYELVETKVIDGYPPQRNGFVFDDQSFLTCVDSDFTQCGSDSTDYLRVFAEHDIAGRVKAKEIDEVFLWGAPGMGFFESMMAGPGAFAINGHPQPGVDSGRVFAVMGFNYQRQVPEMLESLGHRFESTLWRVYGSWSRDQAHAWNRFTALDAEQGGLGGVGNSHNAVNAANGTGYDRDNPRLVSSSAADWYRYPNLTGARAMVNHETWRQAFPRNGDGTWSYMVWWYDHVPRYAGRAPDGRLNNWWRYFALHEPYKGGF